MELDSRTRALACPWHQRLVTLRRAYPDYGPLHNTTMRLAMTCSLPAHGEMARRLVHHFESLLGLAPSELC